MTYNELRAALSAYMHRTDPETVDNEPIAIELGRVKLARSFFPELAADVVALVFTDNLDGTASAPLPVDFGQADVVYTKGDGDLDFLTPREFARAWAGGKLAGAYTVVGTVAKGAASLATVGLVMLTYYRMPEAISGLQTNWCSTSYPDVWLWQAIAEQHRFVQDGESAAMAEAYADELAGQTTVQTRANVAGGALRMSTR